jgi:uncharacterized membrane protein YphA (DoxX/SURF4 family)
MLPSAARYATVLAVVRIYTGISWLIHGFGKLSNPNWAAPNGMFVTFVHDMTKDTSGPYHDFVTGIVLPHFTTFAPFVAWGETLTGVALTLGLLTRLGGAGGVFLALNYWLSKGSFATLNGYAGLDMAAIALSAINLALPSGLVAGIDAIIAARKRPTA